MAQGVAVDWPYYPMGISVILSVPESLLSSLSPRLVGSIIRRGGRGALRFTRHHLQTAGCTARLVRLPCWHRPAIYSFHAHALPNLDTPESYRIPNLVQSNMHTVPSKPTFSPSSPLPAQDDDGQVSAAAGSSHAQAAAPTTRS
jgi:hypothetical protein